MGYPSKHFLSIFNISLSIQKNEKNHKYSTPSKIKFHIILIYLVFLWWILKILQPEGVLLGGGNVFFDRVTILFHQCNNTNITYQQFSYLRWYFTHCYYCDTTMCFSIPLKIALRPQKCIFPHCFWPRWLKQTSFCREFDYLDCHIRSFCVFDLLQLIKKTHEKT